MQNTYRGRCHPHPGGCTPRTASKQHRARILACCDVEQFDAWLRRAVAAETIADVLDAD
jgi:hypothetical protein